MDVDRYVIFKLLIIFEKVERRFKQIIHFRKIKLKVYFHVIKCHKKV